MRTMLYLTVLLQIVAVSGWKYLDCPGNTSWWHVVLRRCCKSAELPNGCECFDVDNVLKALYKPKCPKDLGVEFHLYTRTNKATSQIVKASDNSIASSNFDGSIPTKFVVHGFTDWAPRDWSVNMKDELLKKENLNVILVNWKEGAKAGLTNTYLKASANVRTVGAMVAQLVRDMKTSHEASLSNFHLIGHSLGAHVCGMAGKEIKRLEFQSIARITGLDPAGPDFQNAIKERRLDDGDATFVDVIHTDGEPLWKVGFGISKSIGNVDFFANGGQHQPGCPPETGDLQTLLNFKEGKHVITCSHNRVLYLFTNSINKCKFLPANNNQNCAMGYDANHKCSGDQQIATTSTEPFC